MQCYFYTMCVWLRARLYTRTIANCKCWWWFGKSSGSEWFLLFSLGKKLFISNLFFIKLECLFFSLRFCAFQREEKQIFLAPNHLAYRTIFSTRKILDANALYRHSHKVHIFPVDKKCAFHQHPANRITTHRCLALSLFRFWWARARETGENRRQIWNFVNWNEC